MKNIPISCLARLIFSIVMKIFFPRDAFLIPSRCMIHPLVRYHLSLVSVIIYASCQPSYKPIKRAVAGSLSFFSQDSASLL